MSIVTEYIDGLNSVDKPVLSHLYDIVHEIVPEAEDAFTYGVPTFRYKGKYMIAFSSNKNFMSIYPGAETISVFKEELKNFKTSKGTISFTAQQQLPDELLKNIVHLSRDAIDQRLKK